MLRRRKSLPFPDGLGAWLAVALLAIAAILLYTNLASAHESSTERTLSAAGLTGEDVVELSRDTVTGAVRYELSARTSVYAQQQQDLDPVYITTLGPPADGAQQQIVMPRSVTVSEDDPWFGPFYTLNDPDRSVSIDVLRRHGFIAAIKAFKDSDSDLCSLPSYRDSSLAIGYQTAAREDFYVRRCPGFEHLTSLNLTVTTYPDAEVYTTHHIRIISYRDPTPTTSARTATPTQTSTPTQTPGFTPSPTATPTATLEADAAATATPTATATATAMTLSVPALTAEAAESAVELSWTAVSGAARYDFWVWDRVNEWRRLDEGDLTGTTYNDSGITAGTNYYYFIRAVNDAGQASDWSHYLAVAVPAAPASASALSAPLLIAAAAQSSVVLSWRAVAGAVRYELWVWDSVNEWQQLGGDNLSGTAYTHTGVTAGTTYYYTILAVTAGGETSDWSQYLMVTVPAPPAS